MNSSVEKIIHVVPYYPPHMGGMELRVRDLATRQAQQGHEVTVLTSGFCGRNGRYTEKGVKIAYLRSFEFAHTPIAGGLFWKLFTISRDSIIHLHISQSFFPEIAGLVAAARQIPYVAHIRSIVTPSGFFGFLLPFYRKFVLKSVLQRAARIIVLTPGYKTIMHEQFDIPLESISVIPNATIFKIREEPRRLTSQPLKLLAVGRVSAQKNYLFMIKALADYKKNYPADFVLKIIGGGQGWEKLAQAIDCCGLGGNIKLMGEITGSELEKFYEEADLFIHTSVTEGFASVFIEAMAKGLPIVATNIPGTADVVKDGRNGMLINFTADEFGRALNRLAQDTVFYQTISKNNLEDVKQYDWNVIVASTQEVYNEIKKNN
jgi:glycosyltransferase involved in cell wall biosynthesis